MDVDLRPECHGDLDHGLQSEVCVASQKLRHVGSGRSKPARELGPGDVLFFHEAVDVLDELRDRAIHPIIDRLPRLLEVLAVRSKVFLQNIGLGHGVSSISANRTLTWTLTNCQDSKRYPPVQTPVLNRLRQMR